MGRIEGGWGKGGYSKREEVKVGRGRTKRKLN